MAQLKQFEYGKENNHNTLLLVEFTVCIISDAMFQCFFAKLVKL